MYVYSNNIYLHEPFVVFKEAEWHNQQEKLSIANNIAFYYCELLTLPVPSLDWVNSFPRRTLSAEKSCWTRPFFLRENRHACAWLKQSIHMRNQNMESIEWFRFIKVNSGVVGTERVKMYTEKVEKIVACWVQSYELERLYTTRM